METTTEPRYDLPRHTWRALHSAFIDFITRAPEPIQDAFATRLGGDFSYQRFMLAIHHARVLNVSTVIDDATVRIGVSVPVIDGDDWVLTWLPDAEHGASMDWLMTAGALRIDEQLEALLRT